MATNEQPSFGRLVLRLAWENTWRLFKRRTFDLFVGVASLAIGGAVYWYFFGWVAMREQIAIFLAFVFAPGGLFLLFAFLWNLYLASDQLVYDMIKSNQVLAVTPALPSKEQTPVNWAIWKQMSKYTIAEFAAILAGNDPTSAAITSQQAGFQRLLLQEAKSNLLSYEVEYGMSFEGNSYRERVSPVTAIFKGNAIKWAEGKHFDVSHIK